MDLGGGRVKERRLKACMKQDEVEEMMFWSSGKLSRVENNHQALSYPEYTLLMERLEERITSLQHLGTFTYQRFNIPDDSRLVTIK